MISRSGKLTPTARTRMRTSPRPGVGSGTSSKVRVSGPPGWRLSNAFMRMWPWWSGVRLRLFALLQLAPHDLAGTGFRQRIDELDHSRHLVGRHVLPAPVDDGLRLDAAAPLGARHDHRLDRLAAVRVLGADHARLLNGRVLVHERLDLGRPNLVARRVDHALQAVDDEEIALLIHAAEIAAAKEALAVDVR